MLSGIYFTARETYKMEAIGTLICSCKFVNGWATYKMKL